MFTIKLLDKTTKKIFTKNFDNFYKYNNFKTKLKYSKKLIVISTEEF
jgi:hypothetical protein